MVSISPVDRPSLWLRVTFELGQGKEVWRSPRADRSRARQDLRSFPCRSQRAEETADASDELSSTAHSVTLMRLKIQLRRQLFLLAVRSAVPVGISKVLDWPLEQLLEIRTIVRHFATDGGWVQEFESAACDEV